MEISGNKGWNNMEERKNEVEMWSAFPGVVSQIYILIAIHYFDLITVIISALIIESFFEIVKYFYVSSYKFIFYSLGHSIVLWIWIISTSVYFIAKGNWLIFLYILASYTILPFITSIPGIIIDRLYLKLFGKFHKEFAKEKFESKTNKRSRTV